MSCVPTAQRRQCVHCGHPKVTRPRGLCWACFKKPGVKDLYPITTKYYGRDRSNDLPECWACSAVCPKRNNIQSLGWATYKIKLEGQRHCEVYCPKCIAAGNGRPDWDAIDEQRRKNAERFSTVVVGQQQFEPTARGPSAEVITNSDSVMGGTDFQNNH